MRAVLLLPLLVLVGCSANDNETLFPLPTPVHVRYASQASDGCREDCPGIVLAAGGDMCNTMPHRRQDVGTTLRVTLLGFKPMSPDGICVTVVAPSTEAISFTEGRPMPETIELVWQGKTDRYRVAMGRLVAVDTSFSTSRPWGS